MLKIYRLRLNKFSLLLSCISCLALIAEFGFPLHNSLNYTIYYIYTSSIITGIITLCARAPLFSNFRITKVQIFDAFLLGYLFFSIFEFYNALNLISSGDKWLIYSGVIVIFIRELSVVKFNSNKQYINPAKVFVLSFIFIILAGTAFLLLPNATHNGISIIDALFTSTSAVCVTGLVVVDTGTYFTRFGQVIIALLIQIGGLGIMTFTSYFSYFFRGKSSYKNQLMLKDFTSSERLSDVFSTLRKIIVATFAVEIVGALIIYACIEESAFSQSSDRIFFSIFHTISGFCNAGFSTLSSSFYDSAFRFNYPLHLGLAGLFILGGIGFPVIFNIYKYVKHFVLKRNTILNHTSTNIYLPWVLNINTRIVVATTAILIISETILVYIFEYNNTLGEHGAIGKLVISFFTAVTPRTAGFNVVNTADLALPTIMLVFLLMWIGASPASTGGGIKTSAFAIGTLNFISLARGKNRIEIFKREISYISVQRAFAVISLSLVVIGGSVFLIMAFDDEKELLDVAFECFSAYSTVGLSLGITSDLNGPSKLVIIVTMLVGRVSMLTILIALFRKVTHMKYKYPSEEVLIN